jgi:hypothetical protein
MRPATWYAKAAVTFVAAAACCGNLPAQTPSAAEVPSTSHAQGPVFGLLIAEGAAPSSIVPVDTAVSSPVYARLVARWDSLQGPDGALDWTSLEAPIATLSSGGYSIVLCLTGGHPIEIDAGPEPPPSGRTLEAWLDFARAAVGRFADRVSVIEVWDRPDRPEGGGGPYEAKSYAFLLKSTAVAAKAEARKVGASVRIAQGAIASSALAWQQRLWDEDVASYVDVLPVRVGEEDAPSRPGEDLAAVFRDAVAHPPAPELWAYVGAVPGSTQDAAADAAVEALAAPVPASVAFVPAPAEPRAADRQRRLLLGLRTALAGHAAASRGQLALVGEDRAPLAGARVLGRFLRERDLATTIAYAGEDLSGQQGWLLVDAADLDQARVLDPLTGQTLATIPARVPGAPDQRALRVVFARHPMLVTFGRVSRRAEAELPPEALKVATVRGLTAEEIIARYQETHRLQSDRLTRWTGRGRAEFHYKLAQMGSTIDVAIDSNYFWDRTTGLEWQQTDYYINGNRIGWKKFPELPLIQPEKVLTLPLDLTFDRTYTYRLIGEDKVDDREAYVISFEPVDPDAPRSLYRGRVWIDKVSFVRLRQNVVQTRLETPVLSSEEDQTYTPVQGPDGATYWMLSRSDGQQLWTAGGRNLVVRRVLAMSSIEINPEEEEFTKRRRAAYASTDVMLRDTEQGNRYLEQSADGGRTVKSTINTRYLFAGLGAYKDSSLSSVAPLGGVNYFDYDVAHKNIQMNVFFAGLLTFFNMTKPDFTRAKLDLAFEATLSFLKRYDRLYVGDVERVSQRVRYRDQWVSMRLGVPLGKFGKLTLMEDLEYYDYSEDPEAASVQAITRPGSTFVLPQDHVLTTGALQLEFNRRGYTVTARGAWSHRSVWEPWGLPGTEGYPPRFDPETKSFWTWRVSGFKEWYLPRFQKVRVGMDLLDGTRLDRFSRFQFSFFGDTSLSGFAGTGVRFDRGAIARVGYSFNLFNVVRLDLLAEHAQTEDATDPAGYRGFSGVGVSGNVVGPWKTIFQGSYARAVASDIPGLVGQQQFELVILMLF